jgi:hypothetical protein
LLEFVKSRVFAVDQTSKVLLAVIEPVAVDVVNDAAPGDWTVCLRPDDPGLSGPLLSPGEAHAPAAILLPEPGMAPTLFASAISEETTSKTGSGAMFRVLGLAAQTRASDGSMLSCPQVNTFRHTRLYPFSSTSTETGRRSSHERRAHSQPGGVRFLVGSGCLTCPLRSVEPGSHLMRPGPARTSTFAKRSRYEETRVFTQA